MDTIEELMQSNDYPMAWVQGHHTRITMNENAEYRVYQRADKNSINSQYTVIVYQGHIEWRAVHAFIDSENE